MIGLFGTQSMDVLEKALGASLLRQKVCANNFANVDTPGFKRSSVSFESALEQALSGGAQPFAARRTDPRHLNFGASATLDSVQPTVVVDSSSSLTNNGNNVSVDAEMSRIAENQLMDDALTQELHLKFAMLKNVIG